MRALEEAALVGAIGLGAYELYHVHQYGSLGFGNPYNQGAGFPGFGGGAAYGNPYGYNPQMGMGYGGMPPHHHHHHMM